ncbi:cysteine-rich NFX-1 [Fusarium albosuccineum]|uniref:Cysteine-rich NFX-1 n=1 Tax=Fusarium albosuccineum TaxID=1237068 RepID=A0A8H4P157_9HYPO|nr:cysteine-rich NFX-1 [Fusarium albosuccineum]
MRVKDQDREEALAEDVAGGEEEADGTVATEMKTQHKALEVVETPPHSQMLPTLPPLLSHPPLLRLRVQVLPEADVTDGDNGVAPVVQNTQHEERFAQQPSDQSQSNPQPTTQSRSRGGRGRGARKQDRPRQEVPKSTAPDLWQRIQEDISNWNYECRICTEEVTRKSEVWPCTICWTVVHLECAHQWWGTSMKVNESTGDRSWRCPGCNSSLTDEPGDYQCWCGKELNPSRNSILPPHSCGQTCSKPRSTCSHPCPLQCHPGPCPPCDVLSPPEPCYCGKHTLRKNCRDTDYYNGWSCREPCGDLLSCGEHECPQICHPGVCGTCVVPVTAKCYCGRAEKEMECFKQDELCDSYDPINDAWFQGSFSCEAACGRAYDCGTHRCETSCHPQDQLPAHCPFFPGVVTHCPCGKTALEDLMDHPRQSCEERVPHCERICEKKLNTLCASKCARQPGTADDTDVESLAAQVKRRRSNESPNKRSSASALTPFQLKLSISVFSLLNLAELASRTVRPSVGDSQLAVIRLWTISVTLMMLSVLLALTWRKRSALVGRLLFATSHVISSRLIAVRFADRGFNADSTRVGSFAIVAATLGTAASRTSAMARLVTCNEATACQVKMVTICPCGNYKKEFKCLASTSNPSPNRPELRCNEECERLDRNRRLAAALNIDPASHTNDHVPFSDNTLKLYKQFSSWGDSQESQFRVFASNPDEVRLRYEPMRNQSRQFLHLLAEDFGFESKSEDYDIHRSVVVWKTDKFVSAPLKTLAQCVKIRAAQAAQAAATAALRPPSPPPLESEPFNGLVVTEPRLGLTIDEVTTALASDLASIQGFSFKVDFLKDEVLIKATAQYSAFRTPAPVEKTLASLKPRIEQTIRREKLAEGVLLCHSDTNGAITRREVLRKPGAGGWSAVAGRAASKPTSSSSTPAPDEAAKPARKLLGLKKKKPQQPEAGKVWAALDGDVEC